MGYLPREVGLESLGLVRHQVSENMYVYIYTYIPFLSYQQAKKQYRRKLNNDVDIYSETDSQQPKRQRQ
jgi:hypothetical protein